MMMTMAVMDDPCINVRTINIFHRRQCQCVRFSVQFNLCVKGTSVLTMRDIDTRQYLHPKTQIFESKNRIRGGDAISLVDNRHGVIIPKLIQKKMCIQEISLIHQNQEFLMNNKILLNQPLDLTDVL